MPPPPEKVAIAIGRLLKSARKSSPCTDSQAMALVRQGGIEPLYSGAQITQRGGCLELGFERGNRSRRALRLSSGGEQGQVDSREIEQVG